MTYAGYADIKITNLNSTDLTDYQVKIELNSTNFSNWDALRDDGIDIYFTLSDGTTEIPFWREKFDKINKKATFWVKVPSISANSYTIIKMYFSNLDETVDKSNGTTTFEFFDDFEGGSLDTAKWNSDGGSISLNNGILEFSGVDNRLRSNTSFSNSILKCKFKAVDSSPESSVGFLEPPASTNSWYYNDARFYNGLSNYQINKDGTTIIWDSTGFVPDGDWHNVGIIYSQSKVEFFIDGNSYFTYTDAGNIPTVDLSAGFRSNNNVTVYSDYIFVRKYADQDPTFTIESVTLATGYITSTLVKSTVQQSVETFTGDGTTTSFTVLNKPMIPKVRVFIDNIERIENTDFTVDYTNSVVTFSTAPSSGSTITIVYYHGELNYIENAIVKAIYNNTEWSSTTADQYGQYTLEIPKNVEVQLRAETDEVDSITVVKLTD